MITIYLYKFQFNTGNKPGKFCGRLIMGYHLKLDRIIIYLIIMKQPYTGSFSISDVVLHRLIIKVTLHRFLFFQKKSYTDLYQSNLTPVPPEVLHGLISR